MYSYFMSFLHISMTQVVHIIPQVRQELNVFFIVNIMGADTPPPPHINGQKSCLDPEKGKNLWS